MGGCASSGRARRWCPTTQRHPHGAGRHLGGGLRLVGPTEDQGSSAHRRTACAPLRVGAGLADFCGRVGDTGHERAADMPGAVVRAADASSADRGVANDARRAGAGAR